VNLERGGLSDALAGLAMHARSVYGIKASFSNRWPATLPLDEEAANHLYRIAQEAITNAVKHGHAKTVRLHLGAVHGKVRLSVADDGQGLSANASSASGMGLRIMRYRARIARGEVRIERGEPSGTRVICECPIDARALQEHRLSRQSRNQATQRVAAKRVSTAAVKRGSAPLTKSRRRAHGEHK
jgi:signal transduction histidine kinase